MITIFIIIKGALIVFILVILIIDTTSLRKLNKGGAPAHLKMAKNQNKENLESFNM